MGAKEEEEMSEVERRDNFSEQTWQGKKKQKMGTSKKKKENQVNKFRSNLVLFILFFASF